MARRKETMWQADFSLGEVRPEAVERDDTALVEKSLRGARNTISLTTGQVQSRPGLVHVGDTTAGYGTEVDLGGGRIYDLHITSTGLVLYDSTGAVAYQNTTTSWTALSGKWGTYTFAEIRFWVISDPDSSSIIIGSQRFPIRALSVSSAGVWTFGVLNFATTLSGAKSQPYWDYYDGVTIDPSARTGAITVTASSSIWTAAHNGMSVRYVDREIVLGSLVSGTVINATVVEELPPTYDIVVASASGYKVGDAVEHSVLGGQGIITGIAGTTITVLSTSKYDGFDAVTTPKLVAPNASQVISSVTAVSPAATFLWDIQMQSPIHGYAGWAARHKGRVYLGDFPGAPLAFAASTVGAVSDFAMGTNDADGFVDAISADQGGELKYIVSVEDLLFLTTKGLFYQPTRDGSPVTPRTIAPISFSSIGVAPVTPVTVDEGCIFADAVGKQTHAAMLAGDVYRSWRTIHLGKFHAHLTRDAVRLGATSAGAEAPEQFIYVVKADGTASVCQWDRDESALSWRPWDTDGSFVAIYQCFGKTMAVVDRTIDSVAKRFRERFETDAQMDCMAAVLRSDAFPEGQAGVTQGGWVTAFATHMTGHAATVYMEGWDLDDCIIDGAGKPLDANGSVLVYPDYDGTVQIGLPFTVEVIPWARRSVHSQRGTREVKRLMQMFVTVQATGAFEIEGMTHGAYLANEDLSIPPPMRSQQFKIAVLGRASYETVNIVRNRPGPFRLLKLGYRVVI